MPTQHRRIQVTEDPQLSAAMAEAQRHLTPGLSRAGQLRELALLGAHQLAETQADSERREMLKERHLSRFRHPEKSGIDWELMENVKHIAWPTRV